MSSKTQRVQFEISEARAEEIISLMETFDIRTKKDLFNNAISFLQWAGKEIQRGRVIASIDEKKESYNELYMPIFGNVDDNDSGRGKAA